MKDSEKYFRRLAMSVVIIGGHDRMVCQYKQICKQFKCKAKVFTQMSAAMSKQIGSPDLIVLFTNTVSHKMVRCAVEEAGRCKRRLSDAIQAVKTHWKRYWGIYVCRGELFRCPWRYFRKKGGSCKENKVMGNTTGTGGAKNFSNKFFAACTVVNKRYDL